MADGEVQKVVQQAKAQGEMKISFVPVDHLFQRLPLASFSSGRSDHSGQARAVYRLEPDHLAR
jgi:hypothetical protein